MIAKRKGVVARRGSEISVDQKREPMNKNRMMRSTVQGELANDREAHIHPSALEIGDWKQFENLSWRCLRYCCG